MARITPNPRRKPWTKPPTGATETDVCHAAFCAGRDLNPNDPRAAWVDSAGQDAIEAYHEGQAVRYENEEW